MRGPAETDLEVVDQAGLSSSLFDGRGLYTLVMPNGGRPLGLGNLLLRRPRLARQHYGYLLRQLQETAAGKRPGMDRSHVGMLKKVSPAELRGVADFLSRVSPELSSIKGR